MLAFGTTTVPTAVSMRPPHDPSLVIGWIMNLVSSVRCTNVQRDGARPYHHHVAAYTFPDFSDEEVHVGTSHTNTDYRQRDSLVPTCDSEETTFGTKPKKFRGRVQIGGDAFRSGRRTDSDLDYTIPIGQI